MDEEFFKELKYVVDDLCDAANDLQQLLLQVQEKLGRDFFKKPVQEMGISDKVKAAMHLLMLQQQMKG